MAHIHDLIDFAVEVFVVFNNRVLLRKHDKYKIWLGVGGHIELNEDPNQAAVREVKEEVNLDIILFDNLGTINTGKPDDQELIPPFFMNKHRISDTHQHIAMIYFAKSQTNEVKQNEEEKTDYKWLSKEEIENSQDISPTIRTYALKALEKLSS